MTIKDALKMGLSTLKDSSLSPQLDAEVLLSFLFKENRAWLLSHFDNKLTPEQQLHYLDLIKRRSKSEPIAYIIGSKEFYGRKFLVTPSVLIPRPESEQIIDLLKEELALNIPHTIVDVGTGSGCLAITAALESPNSKVYALDVSDDALEIAQQNKEAHRATNVTIQKSDLLQYLLENNIKADVIIANLPYLTQKDLDDSPTPHDLSFEPQDALLASDNGLELIKKCTEQSFSVLKPQGILYLEMLPEQIEMFTNWVNENNFPVSISSPDDLMGKKRIVVLKKNLTTQDPSHPQRGAQAEPCRPSLRKPPLFLKIQITKHKTQTPNNLSGVCVLKFYDLR